MDEYYPGICKAPSSILSTEKKSERRSQRINCFQDTQVCLKIKINPGMQDYQVPNKVNTTMSGIQLKITTFHTQPPG